jgi:hypothetical protein
MGDGAGPVQFVAFRKWGDILIDRLRAGRSSGFVDPDTVLGSTPTLRKERAVPDGTIADDAMTPDLSELSFVEGGPTYRLMQRLGIVQGSGLSVGRRSLALIAITWVPMLVLSILGGVAIGQTPRASFLLDFACYARFFIAIPLIVAAESVVGPRLRNAGSRFIEAGIVQPESYPQFAVAVERVRRRREAVLPEALILIITVLTASTVNIELMTGLNSVNWHGTLASGGLTHSLPGFWYDFVALPILQLCFFRWTWRLIIWALFLWDVSQLRLNLLPTHTDMAAGLGFLGTAHVGMVIIPFALGCILCSEIGFRAVFEGLNLASLKAMIPVLIAYLLFVELATYGPLVVFVRPLILARLDALRRYGNLVQQHNQQFHEKWILGNKQPDEIPLGNPDMSSLVDLGSSFQVICEMKVFPVSRRQLVQAALISCAPGVPLAFLVLPFDQVLRLIAGIIT